MASKTAAAEVKVKSGKENGIEQAMDDLSLGAPSTKGQKSGAEKKEPVVKKEARLTQEDNVVQVNSSDDLQSRDAKFKKYLKNLDCKIREKLKQRPLSPNQLEKLDNHLQKLTANQIKPNKEQSEQKQQQYKEQFNQLVLLLQPFCSPPEVWNWEAWQQMSLQEQIKQTEQLKQLVEKYVVAVKYLNIQEKMSTNMPQSSSSYELTKVGYTSEAHINYVSKYCGKKKVLFLGINTSERGMELGGVPFCDDKCFSNWLRITKNVQQSKQPSRNANVDEFDQARGDSVGKRFWGLVKEICGTPEVFFQDCFVHNYCPLLVLEDEEKYVSLSDMKVADRQFEPHCNQALRECVQALDVGIVVAVGDYVAKRAKQALTGMSVERVEIPHPSPHNTKLKYVDDWKRKAKDALGEGILNIMNQTYTTPKNAPAK